MKVCEYPQGQQVMGLPWESHHVESDSVDPKGGRPGALSSGFSPTCLGNPGEARCSTPRGLEKSDWAREPSWGNDLLLSVAV